MHPHHDEQPDRDEAEEIIEEESAEIDARDPDAPEEIRELIEHAQEMGLPAHQPGEAAEEG